MRYLYLSSNIDVPTPLVLLTSTHSLEQIADSPVPENLFHACLIVVGVPGTDI